MTPFFRLALVTLGLPLFMAAVPILLMGGDAGSQAFQAMLSGDFLRAMARSGLIVFGSCLFAVTVCCIRLAAALHDGTAPTIFDFLLLAPLLIGEGAQGFILKQLLTLMALTPFQAISGETFVYYLTIIVINGLLFGQLFFVLFYSSIKLFPETRSYFASIPLSPSEQLRYVLLPSSVFLFIFTLLFFCSIVGQQAALSQIAFKPSPAQGNELWPHVVARMLRNASVQDLRVAVSVVSLATVTGGIAIAVMSIPIVFASKRFCEILCLFINALSARTQNILTWSLNTLLATIALLVIAYATFASFSLFATRPNLNTTLDFTEALVLSSLAGGIVSFLAFVLGARFHWVSHGMIDRQSLAWMGMLLLITIFLPKSALAQGMIGIRLFFSLGDLPHIWISLLWILVHLFANLPLALLFAFISLKKVPASDWIYLRSLNLRFDEAFCMFILRRHWQDSVLLAGFITIFIMMDQAVNSTFSNDVFALSELIVNAAEGRGASLGLAGIGTLSAYIAVSALLVLLRSRTFKARQ